MIPQAAPSPLPEAINTVLAGRSLSQEETRLAFDVLMEGNAHPTDIERLLLGLRAKEESAEEVAGAAESLRGVMLRLTTSQERLIDTCGTGGGGTRTFNISSAASFIAAGAGVRIAKHGNRSHTTRSGSADLFESLGVDIALPPDRAVEVLDRVGLVFLFAPQYHPAMRHVAPVRKKLGVSTIMNLVGPLSNPAGVRRQVMGVFDRSRGPIVAEALSRLNTRHAVVIHAQIGMDEISPAGETEVWEVRNDRVTSWTIAPSWLGLACEDLHALEGGEPEENARRVERLLEDSRHDEAGRCAVLLNAAAAIYVSEDGLTFPDAADRARTSLETGAARSVLANLRDAAPAQSNR
jgi:anthranilate phosphoribosyltransferase